MTMKPKLSVVIPAYNEEFLIKNTVLVFANNLDQNKIPYEILVVNDHSSDNTAAVVKALSKKNSKIKLVENKKSNGYGYAVRTGLNSFVGDYVAIVMADLSDDPTDLLAMYHKALEGYDCVFGSRFVKSAKIADYPLYKLILNRIVNNIIRFLFVIKYNDVTNAFKLYSKETIQGLKPFLSPHFNLTVELPLKAIVRGYSYTIVPTNWYRRKDGISKLRIKEMGGRYFFIILYCFLERLLGMGDYKKNS
jgi:dolichol-phosphate mannosyltransferase